MLTDAQAAAIQEIIDRAKAKPAPEAKLKPQSSSSMFGASSGVPRSSGGAVEAKAKSDAVATAALKDANPAEILAAWTTAQTNNGGDPNEAFISAFKSGRK
jgi:hypothetical protein